MAHRGRRPAAQQDLRNRRNGYEHRRLAGNREGGGEHGVDVGEKRVHRSSPCSRTRFSKLFRRRYSAADNGVEVMSSSAAIAEPVELSKNVRTSCWSADRLASSGFTAGE